MLFSLPVSKTHTGSAVATSLMNKKKGCLYTEVRRWELLKLFYFFTMILSFFFIFLFLSATINIENNEQFILHNFFTNWQ